MKKRKKLRKSDRKPAPDRIGQYPSHLRGFAVNKYGGNQLQHERPLRGASNSPSGPVRSYTKEEREEYEKVLRERGDLK